MLLHRDGRGDVRMGIIGFESEVIRLIVEDRLAPVLHHQARQCPRLAAGVALYDPAQLKSMQEIITLLVFIVFSTTYLGAAIKWNHLVGFALIVAAAFFIFLD